MLTKLQQLEFGKLFQEYVYLLYDVEYKKEYILEKNPSFLKAVDEFTVKFPEEKPVENIIPESPVFENKVVVEHEKTEVIKENSIQEPLIENSPTPLNPEHEKLKYLYRQLAIKTHPDKVNSDVLKDIYIRAKKAYENKSLFELYVLCDKVGIQYEVLPEELIKIKKDVNSLHKTIKGYEMTYVWLWSHAPDSVKTHIVKNYVKFLK